MVAASTSVSAGGTHGHAADALGDRLSARHRLARQAAQRRLPRPANQSVSKRLCLPLYLIFYYFLQGVTIRSNHILADGTTHNKLR